jgi:hypothetical protein
LDKYAAINYMLLISHSIQQSSSKAAAAAAAEAAEAEAALDDMRMKLFKVGKSCNSDGPNLWLRSETRGVHCAMCPEKSA